jgi:hypothetical protein
MYRWKIAGQAASEFLKAVLPYLVIKRKQAEIAIEFQATKTGRRFTVNSDKEMQKRELFRASLMALNLRGGHENG